MKQKAIVIIALLALVLMMITPVCAETLNGTLGGGNITSTSYAHVAGAAHSGYAGSFTQIYAKNIQYITSPSALVRFDATGYPCEFDAGWNGTGETTSFTASIGATTIGTGTFGYMRNFAGEPATEVAGFQYYEFSSWDISAFSGDKWINITMDKNQLHNITNHYYNDDINIPPTHYLSVPTNNINGVLGTGSYILNEDYSFLNTWSATKPSGLSITGTVTKNVGGQNYTSRVYLIDAATNLTIASDNTVNTNTFTFNTVASSIRLSVMDSGSEWHNTSVLFSSVTPTPTITPTPTSTPLPQESPYILTLSPGAIAIGGNVTATLSSITDPTLALISGIDYWYSGPDNVLKVFHEPTNYDLVKQYQLYNVTWYQFNVSTGDFTKALGSIPNPNTLRFVDSGTKTVRCNVFLKTGQYYVITGIVIVGQGGDYITTSFQSYDGTNYGFLTWTEIDIYNHNTQTWLNGTYPTGKATISTPPNTLLSAYGTKAGYYLAKYENTPASSTPYSLVFYQIGATPIIGTQLFRVNVIDTNGVRVVGAAVKAVESGTTNITYGSTSASGVATLTLITSTNYIISTSKTGYIGTSKSITTDTGLSGSTILTLTVPTTTVTPGVRTDTEKATDAFSKWIDVLGDITDIAIGVVIIWLMWITVYMITGGKIIDKIMKRGRK